MVLPLLTSCCLQRLQCPFLNHSQIIVEHDEKAQMTENGWRQTKEPAAGQKESEAGHSRDHDSAAEPAREMPNANRTVDMDEVSFLRFVTTRTRRHDDPLLQLAQFVAYGAEGEQLQLVDAQNPQGNNPAGEEPAKALDGSDETKWLDSNKGALECRIASGATKVTKYALVTANDQPHRDPVRWVLEGRLGEDGGWRVLDDKDLGEDQPVPLERHAGLDMTAMVSGAEAQLVREEAEKEKRAEEERAAHAREEARLLIVEPHKDAPGELHAFLLANPSALPTFAKSIVTDPTHAAWLGEAVKATPDLAELTDTDGQHAFAFAHWECKQAFELI